MRRSHRDNKQRNKPVIRKCFSGREINLRGSLSFSCVKQYKLPDCMGAVFGCDNLRDNRAERWGAVLADNQVAAACRRSVVLNNLRCPIVWVRCPVVIIYAIIVRQDEVAVLVDNQVAAACSRSVVLNNLSCPIV